MPLRVGEEEVVEVVDEWEGFLGGFAFHPKRIGEQGGGMCSPRFIQMLTFYTNIEMLERRKRQKCVSIKRGCDKEVI